MRVGDDAIGTVVPPRHPQGYRRRAGKSGRIAQLLRKEDQGGSCERANRVDASVPRAVHTTSDFGATELVEVVCGQQWSVLVGDTRQEPLDRSPWSDPDNRRDV